MIHLLPTSDTPFAPVYQGPDPGRFLALLVALWVAFRALLVPPGWGPPVQTITLDLRREL